MMNEENPHIDLFDAYFDGTLSEKERASFQRDLLQDKRLATDFEAYRRALNLVEIKGVQQEVNDIMRKGRTSSRTSRWYLTAGVAALALLVGSWLFFLPDSDQDLFDVYFAPYPDVVTTRSSNATLAGMGAYGAGDWGQAVFEMEQIKDPSDTVRFYLAVSHLADEASMKAVPLLESIEDASIFASQSSWYLGLAYVDMNLYEEARTALRSIPTSDPAYHKAQKLLRSLD